MTGDEFRELRLAAGLSLTEAARVLGIARTTVAAWQRDEPKGYRSGCAHNITYEAVETLRKLADQRKEQP